MDLLDGVLSQDPVRLEVDSFVAAVDRLEPSDRVVTLLEHALAAAPTEWKIAARLTEIAGAEGIENPDPGVMTLAASTLRLKTSQVSQGVEKGEVEVEVAEEAEAAGTSE
jgi:hypothetical protein